MMLADQQKHCGLWVIVAALHQPETAALNIGGVCNHLHTAPLLRVCLFAVCCSEGQICSRLCQWRRAGSSQISFSLLDLHSFHMNRKCLLPAAGPWQCVADATCRLQAAPACAARAFARQAAGPLQPGAAVVALASPFGVVAPKHFSNMAVTGSVAVAHGLFPVVSNRPGGAMDMQPVQSHANPISMAASTSHTDAAALADQASTPSAIKLSHGNWAAPGGGERGSGGPPLALLDLRAMPGMEGGLVSDAQGCLAGILLQPLLQVKTGVEVQSKPGPSFIFS